MQYAGGIYHVTFRGNARQVIFVDNADRERLSRRVAESAEDLDVRVYLYCWMSNHGHMVVETPAGNLSAFMGSVLTGYTVYYNLRHRVCGHLMQGRFKSQVVSGDDWLLRLSRYIHLNPVRVAAWRTRRLDVRRERLREYEWSSYRGYTGLGPRDSWVTYGPLSAIVPGVGAETARYRRYVESALRRPDEEFDEQMRAEALAIGPEEFRARIEMEHQGLAKRGGKREDVSLRHVRRGENVEEVFKEACERLGVEKADVCRKRRDGTARAIVCLALFRRCGLTERAVAQALGMGSGSAVSYLVRTLKSRFRTDPELAKTVKEITQPRILNSYFQG